MTILFVGRGSFSQSRLSRTVLSLFFFSSKGLVSLFPSSRIDRNAEVDDLSRPETKLCFPVKSNLSIYLLFNPTIERKKGKKKEEEVESPVKLLEAWLRAIDVLTSYIAFSSLFLLFLFQEVDIEKSVGRFVRHEKKKRKRIGKSGNVWREE